MSIELLTNDVVTDLEIFRPDFFMGVPAVACE
jgi:hypothetical protein